MDGLVQFYEGYGLKDDSGFGYECDNDVRGIDVSEMSISDDNVASELKRKWVPDEEIGAWLDNDELDRPTRHRPLHTLRVMWITLVDGSLDISRLNLDKVLGQFQMAMPYAYCSSASVGVASFPGASKEPGEDGQTKVYCFFDHGIVGCMVWAYNSAKRVTNGVVIALPIRLKRLQEYLTCQKLLISHPMAMAHAFVSMYELRIADLLDQEKVKVQGVERRTGLHTWNINPQLKVAEGNYSALSAKMSSCATSLTDLKRSLKVTREYLAFLSQNSDFEVIDDGYVTL